MAGPSATPKILRVGLLSPVRTLDPVDAVDDVSELALAQVYEAPFALPLRAGDPLKPRVFDGPLRLVSQDAAGQVLAAGIARGIVFSDGTAVTAQHVAKCLSRVSTLTREARIEARDGRVLFTLAKPNPRFALGLTLIHSSVLLEKGGRLLGTGPYVPDAGTPLKRLSLVRNPRHSRPVSIDEVHFAVYPPTTDGRALGLIRALENGQADFTTMLSRNDATAMQGVRKTFRPSNATAILYFNTSRPALANRAVRQALTMAIDRRAVAHTEYGNPLAFAATSLLPPGLSVTTDEYVFDPVRAKALLAQAGVPRPLRLEMLTVWGPRPYLPNPQAVGALISRQLGVVGIELSIREPADVHDFVSLQERGEYDAVLAGWISDTPDPADFLEANLRSDRIRQAEEAAGACNQNLSRIQSAELDLDLGRYRTSPGPDTLRTVLRRVANEAPLMPLMYGPRVIVSSYRVQNLEIGPLGMPEFGSVDLS